MQEQSKRVVETLKNLVRKPNSMLLLNAVELAGPLLKHLKHDVRKREFFIENINLEALYNKQIRPTPYPNKEIELLISSAFSLLISKNLIVPTNPGSRYHSISPAGEAALTSDEQFAEILNIDEVPTKFIHPRLRRSVVPILMRGDYDTAIFRAFKEVEVAVREACATISGSKAYGDSLINSAFNPDKNGPLVDENESENEKKSILSLFAGAFGHFRNPQGHRHVGVETIGEAIEAILLAGYLLRVVEHRTAKKEQVQ